MADLNALIAQGAQFRVPPPVDPMGNMPQLMQMRAAQNQNALAQYQLGAAQRTDEQQLALNALARNPNFNPNTPEGMRQAQQFGAPGYALVKSAREASSAGVTQDQARANLLKEKMAMLPDAYRMADTPEAYAQLQESIHADPVIGPWLNSIGATREKGVAALQDALAKPNGFEQLRMGSMKSVKDILEGNKLVVTPAGSSVFDPNLRAFVGTAPDKAPTPTDLARLQNERAALLPGDPRIVQYDAAIRKATTSAPGVQVNVGTEKKYGEQFAGEVAKGDVVLRAAAQDAPAAAENANRILQTLATGKAIVGAGADIKLGIAKLLNIAGADNAEIISNTEGMVTSMAQNTLNAIKTSGLGTGQGFTDKDLKFLEAAKSGNINFQPDTIRRLAELSHKAAEATADKWNSRAREIPASAIQGTGVSLEPVRVPKRASSVTEGVRPSGVGANWTLLVDANGSKAWVSPDRKQIKEVQ